LPHGGLRCQAVRAYKDVGDGVKERIPRLGRLQAAPLSSRTQRAGNGLRDVGKDPVTLQNGQCLCVRRGIRCRGTRSDHIQRISNHIGENQDQQPRRGHQARHLSTLDPGKVLAHGVELDDSGSCAEQQIRRALEVLQRKAIGRRRQQG